MRNPSCTIHDQNGLPILSHDEYMRPGTDMQTLGALKPSFKDMGETMPGFDKVAHDEIPASGADQPHPPCRATPAGIVDGAAAILIGSMPNSARRMA